MEMEETVDFDGVDVDDSGWINKIWKWTWFGTSSSVLGNAETAILQQIETPYTSNYVNIGPILGDSDIQVWTFRCNESLDGIPVVFVHGLGSGLALWMLNLKALAASQARPVYAIDLPGFGRSSRPNYSDLPEEAENQLVLVIEAWRAKLNLEQIILLGHSFGGYLSYAYSIRYPQRIAHLILVDPWGFKQPPMGLLDASHIPVHHRYIANFLHSLPINPLWAIRVAGPLGPRIIRRIREDLISNFLGIMDDAETKISNYIYHCNVQSATGESAFYALMTMFGWAKNPMEARLESMDANIPLTLLYGRKSWVDHYPAEEIIRRRPNSYVNFQMLKAGHHVYADQAAAFNQIVIDACKIVTNSEGEKDTP